MQDCIKPMTDEPLNRNGLKIIPLKEEQICVSMPLSALLFIIDDRIRTRERMKERAAKANPHTLEG
jgi:hypothetical protein